MSHFNIASQIKNHSDQTYAEGIKIAALVRTELGQPFGLGTKVLSSRLPEQIVIIFYKKILVTFQNKHINQILSLKNLNYAFSYFSDLINSIQKDFKDPIQQEIADKIKTNN